jgi:amino acid transporter
MYLSASIMLTHLGYTCFLNPFSAQDFVINYILLPVFILFYFGWKFWHKTRIVKVHEIDIWTGRRDDLDAPKSEEELRKKRTLWHRARNVVVG